MILNKMLQINNKRNSGMFFLYDFIKIKFVMLHALKYSYVLKNFVYYLLLSFRGVKLFDWAEIKHLLINFFHSMAN